MNIIAIVAVIVGERSKWIVGRWFNRLMSVGET